jgi:rubredoxin
MGESDVPATGRGLAMGRPGLVKRYMCVICGFVYDEEAGLPDHGIPPGTRFDDLPLNWKCPECGAGKEDFEAIEI